ncbi:hypothetical protein PG991_010655 [Apiospora marii]|uniref:Uncharacterized protein n=1 Tax=Apiospora marii TaxID=335849 RepID=A0ABR1RCW7_9PEZI
MAAEQTALKTPHIRMVHKVCWHLDLNATPVPDGSPECVKYDPEVEGPTPELYFDKYETRSDGAWVRCNLKIMPLIETLNAATMWTSKLKSATSGEAVLNSFLEAQKALEGTFTRAAQEQVEKEENPWHKLPLKRYSRQLRQLSIFAEEMERDVTCHDNPKPHLVRETVLVLAESFLGRDAREHVSDDDLRNLFGESMERIMGAILPMWEGPPVLQNDIEVTMRTQFAKYGF